MTPHRMQKVDVEYCPDCFGIWLDPIDVEKVTRNPFLARYLQSSMNLGKPSDISCPACGEGLRLQEVKGVEIDSCPGCRGTWFDFGEIEKLHGVKKDDLLVTAGSRKKERLEVIEDLFEL